MWRDLTIGNDIGEVIWYRQPPEVVTKIIYDGVEFLPKTYAHWDKCIDFTLMCSACGNIAPYESNYYGDVIGTEEYRYCPYCGAEMNTEWAHT